MLKVYNIQRTCVHDGQGLRTTVFFHGCSLRCKWCQNPESFAPFDNKFSNDEILEIISRDKNYYIASAGGVTLSGGEPFLQHKESLVEFVKDVKKQGLHIAAETALNAPWETVEACLKYVDLFLVDFKVIGCEGAHKELTGSPNTLILQNFDKLITSGANIKLRMVMVPTLNDGEEQIAAAAKFFKEKGFGEIELLKYHTMHEGKAKTLGIDIPLLGIDAGEQSEKSVKNGVELFEKHGLEAFYVDKLDLKEAEFSQRVLNVRNDIRAAKRALCVEADYLKTKYYKKFKGWKKPTPIHRAERLKYVLENKTVKVYPNELLVGNATSKRCAGQVWAEQYGALYFTFIHQINRQKPVSFECTTKEKLRYYFKIFPHWVRKSIVVKAHNFKSFISTIGRTAEMKVGFINNLSSIAHYIVNYERFLQRGTSGLIAEIEAMQKENPENNQWTGMLVALRGLENFAKRYADLLSEEATKENDPARRQELEKMAKICTAVPKNPPKTYHEALQSMLFLQIALGLEQFENAISLGRVDQILYPFYKQDVESGILTYDEAKELLALFVLKLDEIILVNDGNGPLQVSKNFETLSPDQAITFGGVDKNGQDATNDLTYMLLDICELSPLSANMTARVHEGSPSEYLEKLAKVYIKGHPMPELYSDDVQIASLLKNFPQMTEQDARNYSIVGCVEPLGAEDHFGNTDAANMNLALPFLQALKGQRYDLWNMKAGQAAQKLVTRLKIWLKRNSKNLQKTIEKRERVTKKRDIKRGLYNYNPPKSMNELLENFQLRLNEFATTVLGEQQKVERLLQKHFLTPLSSTLYAGCIKTGKDVYEGGATINSSGIQAVAAVDVADSLYALNEVVFKNKLYTAAEVIEAMDANFAGEKNQQICKALLAVPKFGNDGKNECTFWVDKVMQIYNNALALCLHDARGGKFVAGFYSLNVNDRYGRATGALPSGRLKGVPFANAITPHYGMQESDLLSSLNAIAKVNFVDFAVNGTSATLTVDPALFLGDEGVKNLSAVFKTFLTTGGMELQPNLISRETLLDAYHNPEKHKYLMVRIAGYCAYFQELSDELKRIIMDRTCYR
jgi:formate C-acetyltransferase